jgi:NAD(P)-dependent dehydrogenase (short-subunit alcohol dehydrogenase family)
VEDHWKIPMSDTGIPDYPGLGRLADRNFIVLGAGQGIGEQTAHALSQAGARVLCVDLDSGRAGAIARAVSGHPCAADVTSQDGIVKVFTEAREALGVVHGVIDIVGVARIKPLAEYTTDDWEWQFGIVLRHAFLTLRHGAMAMAETGGGSMVFVGSMAGDRVVANQAAYGSAKAALHHLVRCAAVEFGPRRVRVNAVAPGFIRTPRLLQILSPEQWNTVESRIPLRHAATPAQIAATILFLAGDLSSHVTGQVLAVDGGIGNAAAVPDLAWGQVARAAD